MTTAPLTTDHLRKAADLLAPILPDGGEGLKRLAHEIEENHEIDARTHVDRHLGPVAGAFAPEVGR